jgi:hypothetical protein
VAVPRRRRALAIVTAGLATVGTLAGCSAYNTNLGNEPNQTHHTGPPLPPGVTITPIPTANPSGSPPLQGPDDGGS